MFMRQFILLIIVALLLLNFTDAILIDDSSCKGDGSLEIVFKADNKTRLYTSDITIFFENNVLNGAWDREYINNEPSNKYATFKTGENLFRSSQGYMLGVDSQLENGDRYHDDFMISCPGILFTCKALGLEVESCNTYHNEFRAYMYIAGLEQSAQTVMNPSNAVGFSIVAEKNYADIDNYLTKRGNLPKGYEILKLAKNRYLLRSEFSNNYVNTILIKYLQKLFLSECTEDKYPDVQFYDSLACTKDMPFDDEIPLLQPVEPEIIVVEIISPEPLAPPVEEAAPAKEIPLEITEEKPAEEPEILPLEIAEEAVEVQQTEPVEAEKKEPAIETEVQKDAVNEPKPEEKQAEQKSVKKRKEEQLLDTMLMLLVAILAAGGAVLSFLYKRGYL